MLPRLPEGWSAVRYRDRQLGVTRTRQAGGRIEKLYAEELGGTAVISANLDLPGGIDRDDEHLRPCEMPATDVLDFLQSRKGSSSGTCRSLIRQVLPTHQSTAPTEPISAEDQP
jgi:peptide-methionine (S)-S-oxide reductase